MSSDTIPASSVGAKERVPALSLLFGYGPALVLLIAGAACWIAPDIWQYVAAFVARLWGASILLFLAGVRRGLSFFTPDGPKPLQMVGMLVLFLLGLAALVLPMGPALVALLAGYVAIPVMDRIDAGRQAAPAYFAKLRPPQMAVFVAGIVLTLGWFVMTHPA